MNALKKIHHFAKQYKKLHPKKAWKDCIAAGSKKYNASKKVGSTLILQKGETKKKNKVRSVLLQKRKPKGTFDGYKKISGVALPANFSGHKIFKGCIAYKVKKSNGSFCWQINSPYNGVTYKNLTWPEVKNIVNVELKRKKYEQERKHPKK